MRKEQPMTLKDVMRAADHGPERRDAAMAVLVQQQAREAVPTAARQREMDGEREEAQRARHARPEPLKPGTKIKVHIFGWRYDDRPAEVVEDRGHQIVAKRISRGDEEFATVNFSSISLWRD